MGIKELQERRGKLAREIKDLANRQADWNAEDRQKWDELNAAYDSNLAELEAENTRLQQQVSVQNRLAELESHESAGHPNRLIGRDGASLEQGPVNRERFNADPARKDDFAVALQGWFRSAGPRRGEVTDRHREAAARCGINLGWNELAINLHHDFGAVRSAFAPRVRNALSAQDGVAGGFTYGDAFISNLETAMLAFGGMFQVAEVIRTSTGEPMRWPTANDTSNSGRQIGESKAVTATTDPTFGQVLWHAYKFTSDEILVPFELLRDSAFNLADVIASMLGERLGRIQNNKYTKGIGANTPKGIVEAAAAGITAASATAIAFDEVIDLEHSLDPSRRALPGVGYMMHDSVLKALRKLKDGEGRYLWQAGANSGAPDTLNKYPYTINQDMESSIATGKVTMLFGQLSAYKIRQVGSVRLYRLVERHRENDQDAFLAFMEGDGNLLNAGDNPVKKLTQA